MPPGIRHPIVLFALLIVLVIGHALHAAPMEMAVDVNGACPVSLTLESRAIPLSSEDGGFRVLDVSADRYVTFADGIVRKTPAGSSFDGEAARLHVHAEFAYRADYVEVTGKLENLQKTDRGVVLEYWIPVDTSGATLSHDLDARVPLADQEPTEGNVFPVAAICRRGQGVAAAIPPTRPCMFGMAGSARGLCVKFYLGLSPATERFPNRASFAFIIYPVDSRWGFRAALGRYYSLFPDYYVPRLEHDGLWLKKHPDAVPANIEHYGVKNTNLRYPDQVALYEKYDLATYSYVNPGPHHLHELAGVPPSRRAAMELYDRLCSRPSDDPAVSGLTWAPYYGQRDNLAEACRTVHNSACKSPDGVFVSILDKGGTGDSVSFIMNPSPYVLEGTTEPCVGRQILRHIDESLAECPTLDAFLVDSLGSRWPAHLNYRCDHFRSARLPLTIDPEGRVALHNTLCYQELLEAMREKLRARGKFLFGNGVYAYQSRITEERSFPEHYCSDPMLGRFFHAALLDFAGSESGINTLPDRCRYARALMGKKPYSILNYTWEDAEESEAFVNRCLCYAIFATNIRKTEPQYINNPDGYWRDKDLWDWFVPKVRRLSRAGWEPVTCARVTGEDVYVERYGSGDSVYFAVLSEFDRAQDCVLTVDLQSLGLDENKLAVSEIAQAAPLNVRRAGEVAFSVEPLKTCIVSFTKGSGTTKK